MPSFERNLFTRGHEISSQETSDFTLSYSEKLASLSQPSLVWYRVVTDRQTDKITIASRRLALDAVATVA